MIKKIDISSPETFAYLEKQLDLSGKTFATDLLSRPLTGGKVYAYVPENTAAELLYRFESGGIYPTERKPGLVAVQNNARPVVIEYILKYLQQNNEHCCLFEDALAEPSYPYVKRRGIDYVHLGNEMYYFFSSDAKYESVEVALRFSGGHYFLCALSSLAIEKQEGFSPLSSVVAEQLKELSSAVVSFFVRAYDGEGYLEWCKIR
jgi:hypothetical protein